MIGYEQWAIEYSSTFGLMTDRDVELFKSWGRVFEMNGYSINELYDAMHEIASSSEVLTTRQQHLAAINQCIRGKRRERLRNSDSELHESPSKPICPLCANSGFVVVPHPRCMVEDQWAEPFHTASVLCACWIGQRRLTSHEKREVKMMRIGDYEQRFPHWREEMAQRQAALKEMRKAVDASMRVDSVSKQLDVRKLVRDIASTKGVPEGRK